MDKNKSDFENPFVFADMIREEKNNEFKTLLTKKHQLAIYLHKAEKKCLDSYPQMFEDHTEEWRL